MTNETINVETISEIGIQGESESPPPVVKPSTLEKLTAALLEALRPELEAMVAQAIENAILDVESRVLDELQGATDLMFKDAFASSDFSEAVAEVVIGMDFSVEVR